MTLKGYLSSKDYQTIREMQGGEPMSEETKTKCAEARKRINELEAEVEVLREELSHAEPTDDELNHEEEL